MKDIDKLLAKAKSVEDENTVMVWSAILVPVSGGVNLCASIGRKGQELGRINQDFPTLEAAQDKVAELLKEYPQSRDPAIITVVAVPRPDDDFYIGD